MQRRLTSGMDRGGGGGIRLGVEASLSIGLGRREVPVRRFDYSVL